MQNVTIGSNTLSGLKRNGAPYFGDNIFQVLVPPTIGGITIGDNSRIGANCCVYLDISENQYGLWKEWGVYFIIISKKINLWQCKRLWIAMLHQTFKQ